MPPSSILRATWQVAHCFGAFRCTDTRGGTIGICDFGGFGAGISPKNTLVWSLGCGSRELSAQVRSRVWWHWPHRLNRVGSWTAARLVVGDAYLISG